VIKDPTGDFKTGNAFSQVEFLCTTRLRNWPEGITFQNIRTKSFKIYKSGEIQDYKKHSKQ
jgi:hypothetical protein